MNGHTSNTPRTEIKKMPPTALLDLVMYGSDYDRAIGAVDQAYEDLKQWIRERMEKLTMEQLKTIFVNRKECFEIPVGFPAINIKDARVQGEIDCMDFVIALLDGDEGAIHYSKQYYTKE